jgi:hypothetical protein
MHQQRTARESHGADTGVLPRIASTAALLLLGGRRRRPVVLAATLAVAALVVALLGRPVSALSIALRRGWSPIALLGRGWTTSIRAVAWWWCAVLLLLLLLAAVSWPGVVECALACVLVDEEPAALSTLPLGVPWRRNGGWALLVVLLLSPVLLLSSVLLLSVLLLLAVLLLLLLLLLAATSELRDEVLEKRHGVVICYVMFRRRIRWVSTDLKRGGEQQQTQKPSQRLNKRHERQGKGQSAGPTAHGRGIFLGSGGSLSFSPLPPFPRSELDTIGSV